MTQVSGLNGKNSKSLLWMTFFDCQTNYQHRRTLAISCHSDAPDSRQGQPSNHFQQLLAMRWHEVQETEDVGDPPMAGQLRHITSPVSLLRNTRKSQLSLELCCWSLEQAAIWIHMKQSSFQGHEVLAAFLFRIMTSEFYCINPPHFVSLLSV